MDEYERTSYGLKMPTFDGYESKFHIWWTRFQAYARVERFTVGLEMQVNMPTSDAAYEDLLSVDDPEEAQKKIIKTGRANGVALEQLTIEFETESIINMINNCNTT